jgi:predicted RNase H-like HicB family nuclease
MEKHSEAGRIAERHNVMKYTIVFEKAPSNYAAFSPDSPGCVSPAATPEEMRMMIREAIEFHFECLELDGDPVPVRSD